MKKWRLFALLIMCICLLAGCKKAYTTLSGNVETNTILVKEDGKVQTAIVEDFDKEYYDQDTLKAFIEATVSDFNTLTGENTVKVGSLKINDEVAKVLFTYKDMDTYASFNDVEAKFMTVEEADANNLLPETFYDVKGTEEVSKSKILEKGKYKVIVLNEEYDVVVDGKIKYYSGAVPINSKTVQTTGKETSIIVFKP